MTVCHMLLGRPWFYDQKVSYNGYTNTYSFHFKGKKFVLVPLPILEFVATRDKVPVLNMRQISQAQSGEQMLLFVIRREVK